MNEVTNIHLGRQAFTISASAHHALKAYLDDIQKQVGDKEVVNEVELRMAEILNERGIVGEKVVLPEDIEYLKQQLGNPADFSEDGDTSAAAQPTEPAATKRLFRDTENAMLAGVSAGLANYFGLDVVLMRIIFVALAIFGGGVGILLYVVLWLVVPPATTSSEKLQMKGRSVTIDALKESVNRADLPGAARQMNQTVLPVINLVLRIVLKILGVGFIVAGLAVIFGLAAVKGYMLLHHGQLFQENFFPVGTREQLLAGLAMVLAAIIAVCSILVGVGVFKHKWPIRGWVTAVLISIFLLGSAAGIALSADIAPRVRARYESSMYTTGVKNIQSFNNVTTDGGVDVEYIASPDYAVNMRYYGHPDISKIKFTVVNKTLHIDSSAFNGSRHCTMLCLFPEYNMVVQVAAPNVQNFRMPPGSELFFPDRPPSPVMPYYRPEKP